MRDMEELSRCLAEYLNSCGLSAVSAWGENRRTRPGRAVCAVSLRALESGDAGFQNYLGERYDPDTGHWEELYGRRMELTFGLDLYAATAEEARKGVDGLREALALGGPEGMSPLGFSAGEVGFRQEERQYFCPAQAKYGVWATAAAGEEKSSFLDFEVKGTRAI